jgi:hypothetical protein
MKIDRTLKIALNIASLSVMSLGLGCSDVAFSPKADANGNLSRGPVEPVDPGAGQSETPDDQKVVEIFKQTAEDPVVDILIVDDNSSSMYDEQGRMGARIRNFLNYLDDVNWHIGITTTDVSDGHWGLKGSLLKFGNTGSYVLTKDTPNYENLFISTVTREEGRDCDPECPSSDEQPLAATIMAMEKRDTANRGFFRPNANLAVLVLSDEDEKSNGSNNATTGEQVVSAFKSIWSDGKSISGYGIIVEPGDAQCRTSSSTGGQSQFGTHVADFADLTGGVTASICDTDYGAILSSLGEQVRGEIEYIDLANEPEDGSVKVTLTPSQPNIKVKVKGRRVKFSAPPAVDTEIKVTYAKKGGQ